VGAHRGDGMTEAPLADIDAERGIIAASIVANPVADRLMDMGVREHHFYTESLGRLWTGVQALRERSLAIDTVTLTNEVMRLGGVGNMSMEQLRARVDQVCGFAPQPDAVKGYAQRVIELAEWRSRREAAQRVLEATSAMDSAAFGSALGSLETAGAERRQDSLSSEQWADVLFDYLTAPPEQGFVPLPFSVLTNAMGGGIMRGEVMTIAGYTSHGKSIFADQILDYAAKKGIRCHLYMTEMTAAIRGLRLLSRQTGIPFMTLRSRKMDPAQMTKIKNVLSNLPYGVSIVAGWDIEDVVRDALRARHDLVVIDLIHGFHYEDERGLDRLSKASQRLARVSTTRQGHDGCAVIQVAHLSNLQMKDSKSAKRPKPGMHSIKGATSLAQDSDFVCFVWQQDNEEGFPTGEGQIFIPKARSGGQANVDVRLNGRFFRFDPLDDRYE
jgi:replicative DNA helicase